MCDSEWDESGELSMFEALRETIYSEVATLISQNENRPHFLIELFRELQLLSSDYLRQRALYSIQDLVTKYLTEEKLGTSVKEDSRRVSNGQLSGEGNTQPCGVMVGTVVFRAGDLAWFTKCQHVASV